MTPEQRERQREKTREWKAKNPEKVRAASARYREKHPDKMKAARRRWAENNRDRVNANQRQYMARKAERLGLEGIRAYWREQWSKRFKTAEARERYNAARRKGSAAVVEILGEALRALLGSNEIYSAAESAVPRSIPADVRDDIISSICLAVLEGELSLEEIPGAGPEFVRRHYRQFSKFDTISLDVARFHDGRPLIETLAAQEQAP